MDRPGQLGLWTIAGFMIRFDEELEEEIEEYQAEMKAGGSGSNRYQSFIDPDEVDGD